MAGQREIGLAGRILVGMAGGALLGASLHGLVPALLPWVMEPLGAIFLRLLLMLVLPLAVSALVLGVLELDRAALVGTGARAMGWTLLLTGIAVAIGLGGVALVEPGRGLDPAALPSGGATKALDADPVALVVALFPSNAFAAAAQGELVPLMVFAVVVAIALRGVEGEPGLAVRRVVEGIFAVSSRAIQMVLWLAPVGVGALFYALVAKGGLAALATLGRFALVVLGGLALQLFVVYPLVLRLAGRRDPRAFFRAIRPAMLMAFSTASSAATLPTSLQVAEEGLRLPPDTARFVLVAGATGNQNGTALFEGVAVLFLAQLYGVDLSVGQQLLVVGVSVLGGIGTAGVPGGAIPVIAALVGSLGVPPESVGIILGLDRLLDMCRTTLNVSGDLVIAAVVAEGGEGAAPPTGAR
jgi:dicarboxylate/amino acid:cation (Na+ or H+) symporter, DAACS family